MERRPAMTLAAVLDGVEGPARRADPLSMAGELGKAGVNTLLLPLLRRGSSGLKLDPRGRGPVSGHAAPVLEKLCSHGGLSCWGLVDPLAAGPGLGALGPLAARHREWLVRNALGRTTPFGLTGTEPQFSWLNPEYRRHLGDLLVAAFDRHPLQGLVMDLRGFPGFSPDPARWHCCSYQSQARAEKALGIDFEVLLSHPDDETHARWRDWVLEELRAFLESLFARVNQGRGDVAWLLWMKPPEGGDAPTPWSSWMGDGLATEVLLDVENAPDAGEAMEAAAGLLKPGTLLLPTVRGEESLARLRPALAGRPATGLVLESAKLARGDEGQGAFPALSGSKWTGRGALEDQPLLAARELAQHIHAELGDEDRVGRFYRRVATYLATFESEPSALARLHESVAATEQRLGAQGAALSDRQAGLRREILLVGRLLRLVRPRRIPA